MPFARISPTQLLRRYRIFSVKVQLPASVTTEPNTGDIRLARHCVGTASGSLSGVIDEGGDVRSKERNARIYELDWSQSTVLMKPLDESKHLVPILVGYFHS